MKKLSNSIMLILLIAAIFFFYEEMKPIQIDAVELAKAYNTNKIEADKKYLNKVIEVRGIVRTYYQLKNGINFLELKTDSSTINFYCFFMNKQDENTASKLNQQDTIIISGMCVGMDKYKFIEGLKVEVKKIVE